MQIHLSEDSESSTTALPGDSCRAPEFPIIAIVLGIGLGLYGMLFGMGLENFPTTEETCMSDFMQDYVMARAWSSGVDPYRPVVELARQFAPECSGARVLPNASPHAPQLWGIVTLCTFGASSLYDAFVRFLIFQCGAAVVVLWWLIAAGTPQVSLARRLTLFPAMFFVFLGTLPASQELMLGQVNLLLLLILFPFLSALQSKREAEAGVLLGALLGIKIFGWPFLVLLLVQSRFKAFFFAVGTVSAIWVIALCCFGADIVGSYYTAAQATSIYYQAHADNFSLLTLLRRVFWGFDDIRQWVFTGKMPIPPILISVPYADALSPVAGILMVIGIAVYASRFVPMQESVFCVLALSSIASPVSWFHTRLLLLPCVTQALRIISRGDCSIPRRVLFWLAFLCLFVGVARISGATLLAEPSPVTLSWVLLGEALAPVLLLLFLLRLRRA